MTLPPFCSSAGKLTAIFFSSLLSSHPPPDLFLFFAATLSLLIIKNPFSPPRLPLRRRRTLRPPPMIPASHLRRTSPIFSSPESLSDYLTPHLPPGALASWGVSPGTKTVRNLYVEISSGETSLFLSESQPAIPLRAVNVVVVKIRNRNSNLLVESQQLLSDGTIRQRGRPLSEKMRPGETVEEAVVRAVEEELSINGGFVKILEGSYVMRVEEKASISYPGLPARYMLHSVEARVETLPEEGEFSTDEMGEGEEEERVGGAVFVRKHFWKWIDDCDGEQ